MIVPRLSAEVQAKYRDILIPRSSVNNPIEFAGAGEERSLAVYQQCVELAMQQDKVDSVFVYGYFGGLRTDLEQGTNTYTASARALCSLVKRYAKPLVLQSIYADDPLPAFDLLRAGGIPVFRQPETAARALSSLVEAGRPFGHGGRSVFQEPGHNSAVAVQAPNVLSFPSAAELARGYGMPISPLTEVADAEAAVQEAGRTGYPVVLKLLLPGVAHKTEVGAVAANLTNEAQLRGAVERMLADTRMPGPSSERRLGIGPMVRSGVEAGWGRSATRPLGRLSWLALAGFSLSSLEM
ncbi:hypothetical protein XH92_36295 [Bradyrhizobium sp. CCBAU 53421]|nr:hypothetical protein XH92_36295 [Bradyrhizobium sp. CCBAU 53421]